MVLAYSDRIPRAPPYSGYPWLSNSFVYGTFTLFHVPFQVSSTTILFPSWVLHPNNITTIGLGSSDFARHYFRNRFYFLFLRVIRCFSSPGSPHYTIDSCNDNTTLLVLSFLIRTSADQNICFSPQLIAACHVLLRRYVPRHSPVCSS